MSKSSNELAEDRTDWAEDRTLLASERTFAGWMRTGMASIGIALGLRALFGDIEPFWLAKSVASIFILLAIGIFWSARQNACKAHARLDEHQSEAHSTSRMTLLASIMSFGAVLTGVCLWLL